LFVSDQGLGITAATTGLAMAAALIPMVMAVELAAAANLVRPTRCMWLGLGKVAGSASGSGDVEDWSTMLDALTEDIFWDRDWEGQFIELDGA
jgi:hypothetical protein